MVVPARASEGMVVPAQASEGLVVPAQAGTQVPTSQIGPRLPPGRLGRWGDRM